MYVRLNQHRWFCHVEYELLFLTVSDLVCLQLEICLLNVVLSFLLVDARWSLLKDAYELHQYST